MKVSHEKPEIYQRCHDKFGVEWDDGVIMTYGDTVHCKFLLSESKVIHEYTHVIQQKRIGVKEWWDAFIDDPKFRLSQEVEAYKAERHFLNTFIKDRNKRFKMVHQLCLDLSSNMYGNICTYSEAMRLTK